MIIFLNDIKGKIYKISKATSSNMINNNVVAIQEQAIEHSSRWNSIVLPKVIKL